MKVVIEIDTPYEDLSLLGQILEVISIDIIERRYPPRGIAKFQIEDEKICQYQIKAENWSQS